MMNLGPAMATPTIIANFGMFLQPGYLLVERLVAMVPEEVCLELVKLSFESFATNFVAQILHLRKYFPWMSHS